MSLSRRLKDECTAEMNRLYDRLAFRQARHITEGVVVQAGVDERGEPVRAIRQRAHYWQGLPTHESPPANGASTSPDTTKRVEGEESWGEFIKLPETLRCSLKVDTYENDGGKGWTLTGMVCEDGRTYRRVCNHGHLVERGQDWYEIETQPTDAIENNIASEKKRGRVRP